MQHQLQTALGLVLIALSSPVLAQSQIKEYRYDALGRLIEVQITGGAQDGEQRDYTYDEADNRTQVVSSGATTTPPPPPPPPPSVSCTLDPEDFTTTASGAAYPRVRAPAGGCAFPVQLAYSITVDSGTGSYTDWIGNGGVLNAGDAVRTMGINPEETTISGSPLVLHVNWSTSTPDAVINAPGFSAVTINPDAGSGGGGPSCELSPEDFTTTASGAAYPRVRAPIGGCGFPVTLAYTISVQSGSGSYTDWIGNGGVLSATDSVRTMGINPDETTISGTPLVLRVNWSVASGNSTIASPGYSEVTINPD